MRTKNCCMAPQLIRVSSKKIVGIISDSYHFTATPRGGPDLKLGKPRKAYMPPIRTKAECWWARASECGVTLHHFF